MKAFLILKDRSKIFVYELVSVQMSSPIWDDSKSLVNTSITGFSNKNMIFKLREKEAKKRWKKFMENLK